MSLFPSTLTGRILDDGVTEPPVIELQGISAGQLATAPHRLYPANGTHGPHRGHRSQRCSHRGAAGPGGRPAGPSPVRFGGGPRRSRGLHPGQRFRPGGRVLAGNTSLTQGLAGKANQSALDALQVEVNGKSTPASVDLKLANHPTTAAMNSSITSANNSALATVAATYALKSVVDQLALDVAARQTAADVDQRVATALLPMASTSDLNAAVALRTTPTDVSQLIATALLPFVQQTALDAALALRDGRLDAAEALIAALQAAGYQTSGDIATALLGYVTQGAYDAGQALQDSRLDAADAAILAQNAGPYATSGDLTSLQVSLRSAIDGLLAEIATLGGATNLVNAPAWQGEITFDLLAGTNQVRNLHAVAPLSIQLVNDNWTLSFSVDSYSTAQTDALLLPKASEAWVTTQLGGYYTIQGTDDAITAALTNHFTRAEATANLVAGITECKDYTDTSLLGYSDTAQMNQAIADALVPFGTIVQRDAAIAAALAAYYTSAQTDSAIAAGLATIDLSPYWTIAQVQAAITAALVPVTLSNGQSWTGGPTFNLLRGSNVLRNLSVAGALTATFQNLDDTILIASDSYARSETYTQLETGAAITAALDALNLSQYRTEAQVLALIAGELVPYWDQSEVSSFVAGELSNYATNSSAVELRQQQPGRQQDHHGPAGLLHAGRNRPGHRRRRVGRHGPLGLLHLGPNGPGNSGRHRRAGGRLRALDGAPGPDHQRDQHSAARLRHLRPSGRQDLRRRLPGPDGGGRPVLRQSSRRRVGADLELGPRAVHAPHREEPAPRGAAGRRRHPGQPVHPAHPERLLVQGRGGQPLPADQRPGTFGREVLPGGPRRRGLRHLQPVHPEDNPEPAVPNSPLRPAHPGQRQHPPDLLRLLEQRSERRPLPPHRQFQQSGPAGHGPGEQSGRGPRGGPHRQQPHGHELRGHAAAAGDLQIQNALVTVRREDGALLASFADGGISLDRDVTVAAASTLNATTADFAQLLVGSTAASGTFNSSSSVTANLEVVSNLRVEAPLVRCDRRPPSSPSRAAPTGSWWTTVSA